MTLINNKPIRTRGDKSSKKSRKYPSGHIAAVQSTCHFDKRGKETITGCKRVGARFTSSVEETIEHHLIPRRSLTEKQSLEYQPKRVIDTVLLKQYSVDPVTGKRIQVIDPDTLKRVDVVGYNEYHIYDRSKSLLIKSQEQEQSIENSGIKREASRSKRVTKDRYDSVEDAIPLSFPTKEAAIEWLKSKKF